MAWRNTLQLELDYAESEFATRSSALFCLRQFFRNSLPIHDYQTKLDWRNAVVLAPEAEWIPDLIAKAFPTATEEEINFAVFLAFHHQELLIDPLRCDADAIREVLKSEALGKRIRFPWVFGLDLYDKYFTMFPINTSELSPGETDKLLQGTPQGVFQSGQYLEPLTKPLDRIEA